jgi:hypothetical protein
VYTYVSVCTCAQMCAGVFTNSCIHVRPHNSFHWLGSRDRTRVSRLARKRPLPPEPAHWPTSSFLTHIVSLTICFPASKIRMVNSLIFGRGGHELRSLQLETVKEIAFVAPVDQRAESPSPRASSTSE